MISCVCPQGIEISCVCPQGIEISCVCLQGIKINCVCPQGIEISCVCPQGIEISPYLVFAPFGHLNIFFGICCDHCRIHIQCQVLVAIMLV